MSGKPRRRREKKKQFSINLINNLFQIIRICSIPQKPTNENIDIKIIQSCNFYVRLLLPSQEEQHTYARHMAGDGGP